MNRERFFMLNLQTGWCLKVQRSCGKQRRFDQLMVLLFAPERHIWQRCIFFDKRLNRNPDKRFHQGKMMSRIVIRAGMSHERVLIGGRIPKGVEMRHYRMTGILGLILLGIMVCHHGAAADESGRSQPVQIEKNFDQGTLITHTLKLVQPPHIVSLHVSQRRAAEGSDDIQQTYLRFRYETPEEGPSHDPDRV